MKTYRVGFGFDVHRISRKKKKLILGGVTIPSVFSLEAVSDGDVVLHAVADALCGAASLGDIGDYFPPGLRKSRGINSRKIIEEIRAKMRKKNKILNIDATIIAEKPRLVAFKKKIVESLQKILVTPSVNLKIKSKEGLDILGGRRAISCFVVALLQIG